MEYTKTNPLRVVTLCSGYDSQCLALERLKRDYPDFDYELVAWAEFAPESKSPLNKQPAVIAHNALFPQWKDRNLGDMTKIDWRKFEGDIDLLFYSTPCQSISQAGLQHGFVENSGTRSSIIWNVRDAVKIKKPKYLVLENVKAMVTGKFVGLFNLWQLELERLGYMNFAKVLNSCDYGVAQSRERVFLISIRIDDNNDIPVFHFPKPIKLKKTLEDYLDHPSKRNDYFLCDRNAEYQGLFLNNIPEEKQGTVVQLLNVFPQCAFSNTNKGRVYSVKGLAPSICTMTGGNLEPKIIQVDGKFL